MWAVKYQLWRWGGWVVQVIDCSGSAILHALRYINNLDQWKVQSHQELMQSPFLSRVNQLSQMCQAAYAPLRSRFSLFWCRKRNLQKLLLYGIQYSLNKSNIKNLLLYSLRSPVVLVSLRLPPCSQVWIRLRACTLAVDSSKVA